MRACQHTVLRESQSPGRNLLHVRDRHCRGPLERLLGESGALRVLGERLVLASGVGVDGVRLVHNLARRAAGFAAPTPSADGEPFTRIVMFSFISCAWRRFGIAGAASARPCSDRDRPSAGP